MVDYNTDPTIKFRKEIDKLVGSLNSLQGLKSTTIKVDIPNIGALKKSTVTNLKDLSSVLESFDPNNINKLGESFSKLEHISVPEIGNFINNLSNLQNMPIGNAIVAISSLAQPLEALGNSFKNFPTESQGISGVTKQLNSASNVLKNIKGVSSNKIEGTLDSLSKLSRIGSRSKNTSNAGAMYNGVARFLKQVGNTDENKVTSVIDALKGFNDIKIDPNTATFFSNYKMPRGGRVPQNSSSNKEDIKSTIGTVLALLGSGAFLKRQIDIAREISDLAGASAITGFDALSSRVGINALGLNPQSVASQQRKMSNDLVGARLFGDIDPKRLILMSMAGLNFKSSFGEILNNSSRLSPDVQNYILTQLYGEDIAMAGSRYRVANSSGTKKERQDYNKVINYKFDKFDVGAYERFFGFFNGFMAISKTFMQTVMGGSIKSLSDAFRKGFFEIDKLLKNKPLIDNISNILTSFTDGFVRVISVVGQTVLAIGKVLGENNMGGAIAQIAKVLGSLVAGGLLYKTFKSLFKILGLFSGLGGSVLLGSGTNNKSGGYNNPQMFMPLNKNINTLTNKIGILSGNITKLAAQGIGLSLVADGGFGALETLFNSFNPLNEGETAGQRYSSVLSDQLVNAGKVGLGGAAIAGASGVGIPVSAIVGAISGAMILIGKSLQDSNAVSSETNQLLSDIKNDNRNKNQNININMGNGNNATKRINDFTVKVNG